MTPTTKAKSQNRKEVILPSETIGTGEQRPRAALTLTILIESLACRLTDIGRWLRCEYNEAAPSHAMILNKT